MSKRFNIKDQLEKLYLEVPKALLYEPVYKPNQETKSKGLSNDAKLLYGVLLDRTYLSIHKSTEEQDLKYIDDNGDIFIYFDNTSISEILNVSDKKGRAIKKELVDFNLLEEVRQGLGKANRLYLNVVKTNKDNLKLYTSEFKKVVDSKKEVEKKRLEEYRKNKAETIENTLYGKNDRTSTVQNNVQVQYNLPVSNTNKSNTENISKYVCNENQQTNSLLKLYEKHLRPSSYVISVLNSVNEKQQITEELLEVIILKAINNNRIKDNEKWIIGTINKQIDKGIKTVEEYEADIKEYGNKLSNKSTKKASSKSTKSAIVKTKFHNINQTFMKYEANELENLLQENQNNKFKSDKELKAFRERQNAKQKQLGLVVVTDEIVQEAILKVGYYMSLSNDIKEAIKQYAKDKGMFTPMHMR